MSSDEDEDVKLYSALERNQKRRQVFVSLSSSDSEDDESERFVSPPSKRVKKNGREVAASADVDLTLPVDDDADDDDIVVLDDDEENEDDGLLTESERERERQKELEIELEIQRRLAQDTVLNQTRAIMSQISNVKQRISYDVASTKEIIALSSDEEDDDDVQILPGPSVRAPLPPLAQDKGDRITLQVRSNGAQVDDIMVFTKEPFDLLYERFCDLHGLPRSAVKMFLDGESLRLHDTPHNCDLESGDLIDAKVDFSKQDVLKRKRLVRLRLMVQGRRPEVFKIDVTSTLDKLHASFCKKHDISDPDDVEMTVLGESFLLTETVESIGLLDGDEVNVHIKNFVDPAAIELNVRYADKTTKNHHVIPNERVETLIKQVSEHLGAAAQSISLRLDGEDMEPHQTFQYYDLEGGELIDIKLR